MRLAQPLGAERRTPHRTESDRSGTLRTLSLTSCRSFAADRSGLGNRR
jgi:hypothetical protein